jgi:hypothetical protein
MNTYNEPKVENTVLRSYLFRTRLLCVTVKLRILLLRLPSNTVLTRLNSLEEPVMCYFVTTKYQYSVKF